MSFNLKLRIISLLIIFALPLGGWWYYRRTHPRYIPLPPRPEINITVKEGWNLRQIAADWQGKGLVQSPEELYEYTGCSACSYFSDKDTKPLGLGGGEDDFPILGIRPDGYSYEGLIFPDTYRVFVSSTMPEILEKIFSNTEKKLSEFDEQDLSDFKKRYHISDANFGWYDILTMASVVEKEAPTGEMGKVADIFWRRFKQNWALQSCATVNYITGKSDPAVSAVDRQIDSPYNTYKYPGLPPGPIGNPGMEAIRATINPQANDYWYFMAGTDGVTRYARTLDEHNANVAKYLR